VHSCGISLHEHVQPTNQQTNQQVNSRCSLARRSNCNRICAPSAIASIMAKKVRVIHQPPLIRKPCCRYMVFDDWYGSMVRTCVVFGIFNQTIVVPVCRPLRQKTLFLKMDQKDPLVYGIPSRISISGVVAKILLGKTWGKDTSQ